MDRNRTDYIDDYPTCAETFATLRIQNHDLDPDAITEELGMEPSETRGARGGDPTGTRAVSVQPAGWFLSSEGKVHSQDVRRHIDWLLDRLEPKGEALRGLRGRGLWMDVTCYWQSATGHGGPTLSAVNMVRLAALDLDVWFDIYFLDDGGAEP